MSLILEAPVRETVVTHHALPLEWAKFFIPHWVPLPYARFHYEVESTILTKRRLAVAAPRDHAKSTLFCKVFPLWAALTKPRTHLVILESSEELANIQVRAMKQELDRNHLIREWYGDQETDKWSESTIELRNGSSIRGLGAEAAIRGRRPTIIIGDDLESDEMVRSETRRKMFADWFWSALVNTLEAEGQLLLTGTILGIHSFLATLIKNPPFGWDALLYAEPDNPDLATQGFLWPEKWSKEALTDRKKEIGSLKYLQEYCNNPMPDDIAIYKEPWMQSYERLPVPEDDLVTFGGLDVGCKEKEIHDRSALVVYGIVPYGPKLGAIYCLDACWGHWTVYQVLEEIFARQRRWPQTRWGIETVQFQYALKSLIRVEGLKRDLGYIAIDEWQVQKDKVTRALFNVPLFEQGLVHFRQVQRQFVDALLVFPQGEDRDRVDANSMAFFSIKQHFYARQSKKPTGVMVRVETFGQLKQRLKVMDKLKKTVTLPYGMTDAEWGQLANREASWVA